MIQNKKQQVYEIIKNRILREEYPLGSKIFINDLSEELGVSNSPIREAVNLLEKEGLVTNYANNGPSVVLMSKQDWFELAQTIFFWMISAYKFCVTLGYDKAMIGEMKGVLESEKKAYEEKDMYELTAQICKFSRCIIAATGNTRLLREFDGMLSLQFLGISYSIKEESPEENIKQHERILELMEAGKYRETVDAIADHYYKPCWTDQNIMELYDREIL